MIASDSMQKTDTAIDVSKGSRFEINHANKFVSWAKNANDLQSGAVAGNQTTLAKNKTISLQDYAEFRIADYNDYSLSGIPIPLSDLNNVKHRRRISITKYGVGIGDSYNRGESLANSWKPRAMLDVS